MMSAGCGHDHDFDGTDSDYRKRLIAVIVINAAMFGLEIYAGEAAGSQALKADALDFFADALTYGLSLAVIGASLRLRSSAAMVKGASLLAMGLWVAGSTLYQFFGPGQPEAPVMGVVAGLALVANLVSVLILVKYKDGDSNVRSVWLCSRNDAVGNIAVMAASVAVWWTVTPWPDLVVAAVMAALFLSSSFQILTKAIAEWRAPAAIKRPEASSCCSHDHHHGHSHES
jgi:Co/Zn/Cd efflux system component